MSEITPSSLILNRMRPEVARRRIASFANRFGQPHLYLAYHAAFPLALTPDLLYRLWANFSRNILDEQLHIPWVAVADLLLSSLCDEVGHELFEMNVTVRTELLSALKADSNFGQQRISELSNFLLIYIRQRLNSPDPAIRDFATVQRWTALAYIRPGNAASELALALRESVNQDDKAEQVRIASLIETFTEPLDGYAPLLSYARGINYRVRGYQEEARVQFNNIHERGDSIVVEGVQLPIPGRLSHTEIALAELQKKSVRVTSFDMLIKQVMNILNSYIPYSSLDETTAIATIGEGAYKQGEELFETVKRRFTKEYNQETIEEILENFKYPLKFHSIFQSLLSTLLQNDPDFAKELRRIIARSLFIGRDQELQEYARFLSQDYSWMWVMTSMEGNGKTALLQQMTKKTPESLVVRLDFAREQYHYSPSTRERVQIDGIEYLEHFANQVRRDCNLRNFEHFTETLETINTGAKNQIFNLLQNFSAGDGATLANNQALIRLETYNQEQEKNARAVMTSAFFRLMESLESDDLIIHLDSCEWLMEPVNDEIRRWLIEDILLELYKAMRRRGKQLHVVMMSSIAITLPRLSGSEQKESLLGPLDENAVKEYLQRIGVDEPELLNRFYDMTEGHALCIQLLRDQWLQWEEVGRSLPRGKEEQEFTSDIGSIFAQFQRSFYEQVEWKFISSHVLDKLNSTFLKMSTEYAIILREFDSLKFKAVFSQLLKSDVDDAFSRLTSRLYIRQKGFKKYAMCDLFRAALTQRILALHLDEWKEYHERAIRYYQDNTFNPRELLNSSDWYYHNLALHLAKNDNEATGKRYWRETLEGLKQRGANMPLPLLEAASDKTLMFFTGLASEVREYKKSIL